MDASANVSVQKEVQLNYNAIAQEQAIDFADEGQTDRAYRELKKSATDLKAFAPGMMTRKWLRKPRRWKYRLMRFGKRE